MTLGIQFGIAETNRAVVIDIVRLNILKKLTLIILD